MAPEAPGRGSTPCSDDFFINKNKNFRDKVLSFCLSVTSLMAGAPAFARTGGPAPEDCAEACTVPEVFPYSPAMSLLEDADEFFIPTREEVDLIERLAVGIHNWKTTREHGWWECGEFSETGVETEDKAILIAYRLVRAAHIHSDDQVQVNVWGLAATIAHESSFDRCAVGYHFRRWAIGRKLLKPRTRTISYGEEELLYAMKDPRAAGWFRSTGVDVGYCQLLTRFYHGNTRDMMDSAMGMDICARQFRQRSERLRTDRPWRWWRGFRCPSYDARVTRRAYALGARPGEI